MPNYAVKASEEVSCAPSEVTITEHLENLLCLLRETHCLLDRSMTKIRGSQKVMANEDPEESSRTIIWFTEELRSEALQIANLSHELSEKI